MERAVDRGPIREDAMGAMNELSLFTGAGGGLLGGILLGWHPVGYVEWDDYCQRVIKARIEDGIIPEAPIFGDIRTFISEGYAASYTGMVDVITAGFPCQPFSVAGKQRGADDERNMWPATAECIGIVRPGHVLLENVPGIRTYLPVVIRDLRRLGYEVSRPLILGADDVGAPHRRKRVWIVADRADSRSEGLRRKRQDAIFQVTDPSEMRRGKGNEITRRSRERAGTAGKWGGLADRYGHVTHTPKRLDDGRNGMGMDSAAEGREGVNASARTGDPDVADTQAEGLEGRNAAGTRCADGRSSELFDGGEWDHEAGSWSIPWPEVAARLCRVAHGVAHRVDRLKALGNGQVPQVVRRAWEILNESD
jgi:DNA (cytosine-5)-methyltransferase 1